MGRHSFSLKSFDPRAVRPRLPRGSFLSMPFYSETDQVKERAPATLMPSAAPEKYAASIGKGQKFADSWIDSRLRSKFPERIPFALPAPDIIQEISADLAAHFVLKAAFAGGGESKTPTQAQDLFDRGQLALDNLLSGDMTLPPPTDEPAAAQNLGVYINGPALELAGYRPHFLRRRLK